jgi:hypothetical protein
MMPIFHTQQVRGSSPCAPTIQISSLQSVTDRSERRILAQCSCFFGASPPLCQNSSVSRLGSLKEFTPSAPPACHAASPDGACRVSRWLPGLRFIHFNTLAHESARRSALGASLQSRGDGLSQSHRDWPRTSGFVPRCVVPTHLTDSLH